MKRDGDELRELARNLLVATTSLIPGVGGVLSFFIDKYLPNTIEKRRDDFLNKLSVDIEQLPDVTIEKMITDSHYHSMLLKVFRIIVQEDQEIKIEAFRNILINAAINDSPNPCEEELYIRLATDLTSDHMKVLHCFYRRDYKNDLMFENINTYMKQHWTSVDDAYRFALVTELIRDGLITGSKRSKTSGLNGHNLSTLGERFLEYIFSPNEPYDVK